MRQTDASFPPRRQGFFFSLTLQPRVSGQNPILEKQGKASLANAGLRRQNSRPAPVAFSASGPRQPMWPQLEPVQSPSCGRKARETDTREPGSPSGMKETGHGAASTMWLSSERTDPLGSDGFHVQCREII